jgi:hypothetical protein
MNITQTLAACTSHVRRRIACEVVVLTTVNSRRLAVSVPRQRVLRSGMLRRNEYTCEIVCRPSLRIISTRPYCVIRL